MDLRRAHGQLTMAPVACNISKSSEVWRATAVFTGPLLLWSLLLLKGATTASVSAVMVSLWRAAGADVALGLTKDLALCSHRTCSPLTCKAASSSSICVKVSAELAD